MKAVKKIAAVFLMMAVVFSCFGASAVEVQAAAKTTTYVMDSKKGVYYPTKVRAGLDSLYDDSDIYLVNEGDYVASVKSSSSNLIAKITNKTIYTGDYSTSVSLGADKYAECKSRWRISYHANKKGTYTLTVTIKNAKKKTTCTKKIKVYAEEYASPVKTIKYAGKEFGYGSNVFTKKSGTLKVTMNKGFKLQKIEVGTYTENGTYTDSYPVPNYKTVKNNKKISLATNTKYTSGIYTYEGSGYYSYTSGRSQDYLYPVTFVKITYKDTKLGITQTTEYELFYKNK